MKRWQQVTAADLGNHPLDAADGDTIAAPHELFEEAAICTLAVPMPVTEFVKLCQAIDKTFGGDTFLRNSDFGEPILYVRRKVR